MDPTIIRIVSAVLAVALALVIFLRRRSHKEE